jgi:hypothetical protein
MSFTFSFLDIKKQHRTSCLSKDRLLCGKSCDLSIAVDGRKELLGIAERSARQISSKAVD